MNKEQITNLINHPKTKLTASGILSLILGTCIGLSFRETPKAKTPIQQIYTYQAESRLGVQKSGNIIVPGELPTWATMGQAVNVITADTNVIRESVVILGVMPVY